MKLALSAITFHARLFAQEMAQWEVPAEAATLGFDAVELLDLLAVPLPAGRWTAQARQLWHALHQALPGLPHNPLPRRPKRYDPAIAAPLRAAADAAGVRIIGWTMDTDLTARGAALVAQRDYWRRGLATARVMGAEVVRVTTGGQPGRASDLPAARENLAALVELAAGLPVAVENHGGLSSDPDLLVALLEGIPGAGCCLDFGNFPAAIRHEATLKLVPYTNHVHAKSHSFDEQGQERTIAYPAILAALRAAAYDGWFVIEYEGPAPAERGIDLTRKLLVGNC